jgi:hypothetical protein
MLANVTRSLHTLSLDFFEEGDEVNLVVFLNEKFMESHSNQSRTDCMDGPHVRDRLALTTTKPILSFDGELSNRSNELRIVLGSKMDNAPLAVGDPAH